MSDRYFTSTIGLKLVLFFGYNLMFAFLSHKKGAKLWNFIYSPYKANFGFFRIKSFEIKLICPHTFYSGISSATTLFSHYNSNESYVNPVVNSDHPDPGILALPDNSGYVVVTTSHFNSRSGPAFPILFSADLVNWQHVSCSPLEVQ